MTLNRKNRGKRKMTVAWSSPAPIMQSETVYSNFVIITTNKMQKLYWLKIFLRAKVDYYIS